MPQYQGRPRPLVDAPGKPQPLPDMRRNNRRRLAIEQPGQDRVATWRQVVPQRRGKLDQRVGQYVGEDQVERPSSAHQRGTSSG